MGHRLETSGGSLCRWETQANIGCVHRKQTATSWEPLVSIQEARRADEQLIHFSTNACGCVQNLRLNHEWQKTWWIEARARKGKKVLFVAYTMWKKRCWVFVLLGVPRSGCGTRMRCRGQATGYHVVPVYSESCSNLRKSQQWPLFNLGSTLLFKWESYFFQLLYLCVFAFFFFSYSAPKLFLCFKHS